MVIFHSYVKLPEGNYPEIGLISGYIMLYRGLLDGFCVDDFGMTGYGPGMGIV